MTESKEDLNKTVDRWAFDMTKGAVVYVIGYYKLDDTSVPIMRRSPTLGLCQYIGTDIYGRKKYNIKLSTRLERMPRWLVYSVLWHEFCHVYTHYYHGKMNHDDYFKDVRRRDWIYWLGDMVAKLIAPFYKE